MANTPRRQKEDNSIKGAIAWSMRNYPVGWGLTTLFLGMAALDTLDTDVMPESMTCHAADATNHTMTNGLSIRIGKTAEDTVLELPQGVDAPQYFVCEAN